jgi:fructuronate reductase
VADDDGRAVPVRAVHLGLGAFHRSHQAWYTQRVNDLGGEQWGIWAFTGRRPAAAETLTAQGCRYTLIERAADGDSATPISSIVRASAGTDLSAWRSAFSDPAIALCTITVTEAAYSVTDDDCKLLAAGEAPQSLPARVVDGLRARRDAGGAPMAVLSCDNLNGNGAILRSRVMDVAEALDSELARWVEDAVSFPSTMVDRITPATTAEDRAVTESLVGWPDAAPVVTEPYSEWVIAGSFPAGRPAWEKVGVRFVDDIQPYEQRKLWLLNAAHSTLAYLGLQRGHDTVAAAMQDPVCTDAVEAIWTEAAAVLPFDSAEIADATQALRDRFTNPRIQHLLRQIAADGSHKLPVRIIDVHRRRTAAGLPAGRGEATAIAAWTLHLQGDQVTDPSAADLVGTVSAAATDPDKVAAVLTALGADPGTDTELLDACVDQLGRIQQQTPARL